MNGKHRAQANPELNKSLNFLVKFSPPCTGGLNTKLFEKSGEKALNHSAKSQSELPVAIARLIRGKSGWSWVVDCCPYCGKKHFHGGGKLDDDPYRFLGHRQSHCLNSPGSEAGYVLTSEGRVKGKSRILQAGKRP
jgi:hypothetical protein